MLHADALANALLGGGNVAAAMDAMRTLPASSSAMCAAMHAHPERPPLPQLVGQSRAAEFLATRIVDMVTLVEAPAAPDILDAAFVRTLLTEAWGGFASCASPLCVGQMLPGGFPLRQYVSPAQMAHYHATGQLPRENNGGVCYLCHLTYALVAASIGTTVSLPFFHAVNVPGGYVPAALQPSQAGDGLLHPLRRFNVADYHLATMQVHEPVAYDRSGIVNAWTQVEVRGYWEDATLLFGTEQLPVARTIASPYPFVAAPALPSCEAVLCRKLCAPGTPIEFSYLDSTSSNAFHLPLRLAATLGGIGAPETIEVPADSASTQQYVWALTLRPVPESRAVLLYLVACSANNWTGVARMYNLMPSQAAAPVAQAALIESNYPLRTHAVLYLVLARCAEIERMLADGATEFGGTFGSADAVHAAKAKPGVVDQLRAYLAALQPLRALLLQRIDAQLPVSDEYWWTPDGDEILPWLRSMPLPPPAFYVASDLVAYPPAVSVCPPPAQALNSLPGDGMALSYTTFEEARLHVPANPPAACWPCPAGRSGTVWNTIVWRVNAAYTVLLSTASTLATLDDGGFGAAEQAVADGLAAMRSSSATTAQLVAAAPPTPVNAERVAQCGSLTRIAQAAKQLIAAHVPLVLALNDANAATDDAALPIAHARAPRHSWAPEMICVETMFAAPFYPHDFAAPADAPQTLYAWVLAAAAPTLNTDVVARWRYAAEKSHEWREWSRQIIYASLVGAYAHARNMVPFETWIALRRRVWSDDVAALETERTLLLVLREHMIDACARMPATRLAIRAVYRDWGAFAANTLDHAERMRATVAAAGDLGAVAAFVERTYTKSAQTWTTLHRPPPPFPTMLNDALRAIDIERGVAACLQHRCVLGSSDLAPPHDVVRGIGSYVEREPRAPGAFQPAWLCDIGVCAEAAAAVGALQAEYADGTLAAAAATARVRQLAAQFPDDYARIAVFFAVLVPHSRRQLVPLDAATAARQRHVARVGQTHCAVSSVQCCNTIRTFVVQDGANMSGTLPARLNLDTGRITCVPKRGGVYTKIRTAERNGSTAAVAVAMRAWVDGTGSREAVVERLGPYVTSLMRDRYRLFCAALDIMMWPIIGAVFRQQNNDGSVLTCTVCPRCGNTTTYSAGMFSSNMFSCGVCEDELRAQMREASVAHCEFCHRTPDAVRNETRTACATRLLGAAHDAKYVLLDDTVEGVTPARQVWVCGVCNRPWLAMAAGHFSLREMHWLYENEGARSADFVGNIIDTEQQEALLRDLRRSRADPRVPTPLPKRVSLLGRPAPSRKRQIGSIKL